MLKQCWMLSVLMLALIVSGCGRDDSLVNPQVANGQVNGLPYGPGGTYNPGQCPATTVTRNQKIRTGFRSWFKGRQSIVTYVRLCPGAKVSLQANSNDDIVVSNGYSQEFFYTPSELSAGTVSNFQNGGTLVIACSRCRSFDPYINNLSVAY